MNLKVVSHLQALGESLNHVEQQTRKSWKSFVQLEKLKNEEIIVHCQSGKRSNQARKYLQKNGFIKVRSLSGGLNALLNN